mgnify:FL=1
MDFKDYYGVMGVARDATQDDIKRAYRKLARRYHPDVSKEPDAERRFKELGEAYEVLRDPEKRAAYDQLGSSWKEGQEFRPPPGWDAGFEFSGGVGGEAPGGFSDFFETLFGRGFRSAGFGAREAGPMRGEDHHSKIEVDLEHAYHGATLNLDLRVPQYDAHGHLSSRTRRLQVRIPKGVTTGKRIRLAGQGGAGFAGGPPGDLYLEVAIRPHPVYQVEGKDLYLNLPVTPWEAALGARVKVPTLGGQVDVTVPAGSRGGQRLRLKGRGIPVPGESAGDQILVLQVAVPPADTPEKKALYEEMARTMRFDPRSGLGG